MALERELSWQGQRFDARERSIGQVMFQAGVEMVR